MKIHTNTLTDGDIYRATMSLPGVGAEVDTRGSRSKARRLDVKLTGTSNRRPNSGNRGGGGNEYDEYAATWDEWGMFIAKLFEVDPDAVIGNYPNGETFHDVTFNRFRSLTPAFQHKNHNWIFDYGVQRCTKCEAEFNVHGLMWINQQIKKDAKLYA